MTNPQSYAIRGGIEGRERLRILSRVMHESRVNIVQPMALTGERKLITPITLQNIAPAVIEQQLASKEELEELTQELYDFAEDETTLAGLPRVVQVSARRLI